MKARHIIKKILISVFLITLAIIIDNIRLGNILNILSDLVLCIGIASPIIVIIIRIFYNTEEYRTIYLVIILYIGLQFVPHFTHLNYGREGYDIYKPSLASSIDMDSISEQDWQTMESFRGGDTTLKNEEVERLMSKIEHSYPMKIYYLNCTVDIVLIRLLNFAIGAILIFSSVMAGIILDNYCGLG